MRIMNGWCLLIDKILLFFSSMKIGMSLQDIVTEKKQNADTDRNNKQEQMQSKLKRKPTRVCIICGLSGVTDQ